MLRHNRQPTAAAPVGDQERDTECRLEEVRRHRPHVAGLHVAPAHLDDVPDGIPAVGDRDRDDRRGEPAVAVAEAQKKQDAERDVREADLPLEHAGHVPDVLGGVD
jgi:hypothetical protein